MSSAPYSDLWRVFALDPEQLSPVERTLLRTALVLGLFIVGLTLWDNVTYAGVDLRNRVVGARVMLAGHDPYTFDWEPGMPDQWLDPVYDPKAHRLTASPPTLLLYAVGARLPFRVQRHLSFVFEWLALLASLMLLSASLPELRQRVAFLLGATLFIVAANTWRMHLERGQLYVYLLLALSVAVRCSARGSVDSIRAGVALGVLGLMRPNLLLFAPAVLVMRQWRCGGALAGTVSAGVLATCMLLPASAWRSYLDVGEQYYRVLQDRVSIPDRPRPLMDGRVVTVAEGVDFDAVIPDIESSSFAAFWQAMDERWHIHERLGLPPLDVALTSKLVCAALAGLLLVMLLVRPGIDPRWKFALAVVLSLDTEFFLPHRWVYADVVLLAPLALLLPEMLRDGKLPSRALGGVLLGLVAGTMATQLMPLYAATVLRPWLVMGSLTTLAIGMWYGER